MKKYLALVISSFLLAGPVSAGFDLEAELKEIEKESKKMQATGELAIKLLSEAESQAIEQCATTRLVVPLPYYSMTRHREETIEATISIEWSGGCVEGKRDGVGTLSWSTIKDMGNLKTVKIFKSEGRFVKGQRLGLWCSTYQSKLTSDGRLVSENTDSFCTIMAGHAKPPLTGNYRKQPDGSWQEYVLGVPGASSLAAGVLEAHSEKVLADASTGKTDLKVELDIQSHALDDLVRGSKIVLAPSSTPILLKDKRVALVLSSQTISELERFKFERQAFIDASAGLSGDAAAYRAKFIQTSNPDRVLVNIIKVLQRYAKDVQPADDLAGLKKGGFDYALVVDWKFKTRFDLLGKSDSFPRITTGFSRKDVDKPGSPVLALESLGGYLINRDLKAVKQFSTFPDFCGIPDDAFYAGDKGYMTTLAMFYERIRGKDVDKPGYLFLGLDGGLKAMK